MTDENDRTADGHLTVDALKNGLVDKQGWKTKGSVHILTLGLIRPAPALYRVEHRLVHPGGDAEVHRELFNDVRLARNYFRKTRRDPPKTYDKEA